MAFFFHGLLPALMGCFLLSCGGRPQRILATIGTGSNNPADSENHPLSREELIKTYLSKLESTNAYRSYKVTTKFALEKRFTQDILIIFLIKEGTQIGKITIVLNDYDYAKRIIDEYKDFGVAWLESENENSESINKITRIFNDFKQKIDSKNISYFEGIGIEKEHQGRQLSYPLICITSAILKNAFNKKYIFAFDQSNLPNYYTKLDFIDMKFKRYKYADLDAVLSSAPCQRN